MYTASRENSHFQKEQAAIFFKITTILETSYDGKQMYDKENNIKNVKPNTT